MYSAGKWTGTSNKTPTVRVWSGAERKLDVITPKRWAGGWHFCHFTILIYFGLKKTIQNKTDVLRWHFWPVVVETAVWTCSRGAFQYGFSKRSSRFFRNFLTLPFVICTQCHRITTIKIAIRTKQIKRWVCLRPEAFYGLIWHSISFVTSPPVRRRAVIVSSSCRVGSETKIKIKNYARVFIFDVFPSSAYGKSD